MGTSNSGLAFPPLSHKNHMRATEASQHANEAKNTIDAERKAAREQAEAEAREAEEAAEEERLQAADEEHRRARREEERRRGRGPRRGRQPNVSQTGGIRKARRLARTLRDARRRRA